MYSLDYTENMSAVDMVKREPKYIEQFEEVKEFEIDLKVSTDQAHSTPFEMEMIAPATRVELSG